MSQLRKLSHNVVAMQHRRDHNAEQSVNRLPAEVLSQIFEYALEELRDTWPSEVYDDIRLVVTSVCSWWRAIAIANPALWGILIYQDNDDITIWSHQWTVLCLSRSADVDLDVSVSVLVEEDDEDDDGGSGEQFSRILSFMNTIKSRWHRVGSIILDVQCWDAVDAIFPLPEAGPKLRNIEIDILGPRLGPNPEAFRIFPSAVESETLAHAYSQVQTLKLATQQMSIAELTRLLECLPNIRFLRIDNGAGTALSWNFEETPATLFLSMPKLDQLVLAESHFSSANFNAPNLRFIVYELPATPNGECGDFFPTQIVGSKRVLPPTQLTLGDVRSSPDFFEPAVRLLRSYPRVSVLRLHGKEGLGKLLCAGFGGGVLIVAPNASAWEGLEAPRDLQRLEIVGWESAELQQRHVQLPDPAELTELAQVLLELLVNSPHLVIKWWLIHDPTRIQHPAFAELRKLCETMASRFPGRISLKLA